MSESSSFGAPRLIDAREAAELLGCKPRTLYRRADAGLVPFGVKIGGSRRWDVAELRQWVASGCKPIREVKGGGR